MVEQAGEFYDRQEVRDPEQRLAQMFTALPGLVRHAMDNAPGIAAQLDGVDAADISSPDALAKLPVLRKADLVARQAAEPPFGGLAATPLPRLARAFVSPGPICEPESLRTDYWRFARAFFAAGFRTGQLIHNAFSYHLTPAGAMIEGGARLLGCPVIPAGTSPTARQLEAIERLSPVAFAGTPDFLEALLDEGRERGIDISSIERAVVSGAAFPTATRDRLLKRGVDAYECYATADLGLIAYESSAREGLIIDEAIILEIVRPGTGEPVEDGEVGEVLVTSFNPDYPLIRFATGDLSAIMNGTSPCGRTNRRIRGWLGRADQSTKVRGLFVHPQQVAAILTRHHLRRGRLVVDVDEGKDRLRLLAETADREGRLDAALGDSLRDVTSLRGDVELVAPGSLPNDGKVIDDQRA